MRRHALHASLLIVLLGMVTLADLAEPTEGGPAQPPQPPQASMAAVGDLYFGGGLGERMLKFGPDYPWLGTIQVLASAEIRSGNLEAPLSLKGKVYTPKKYTLHADSRTVAALVSGGFNVVSLANNHAMDFGPLALEETISLLDKYGIAHAGAGRNLASGRIPAILTANGLRFAFLSYSLTYPTEFYAGATRPGTVPGYESYLRADIPAARKQADVVIVSFHWSAELLHYPKDYQRKLGRLSIDLGAQMVIGHHPHVLQGLEVYHGGLIAYSLGNFAFGSYSTSSRDSAILVTRFDARGPLAAWLYPVNVNNHEVAFQTRLRTGADAVRVLNDLRRYSASFGTVIEADGDRGVIVVREAETESR
ncbi:MAG: CapA family protein [Bacteroidota bacterium]